MSEGRTVSELIADTLEGLRQPALNYTRYSRASILSALNLANRETASRLKCIHGFAIITLKAGYAQYPPPSDMLDPKDAFFYKTPSSYIHLNRDGWKNRSWLDRYLAGWRTLDGDPDRVFIGDSSGNLRKIGFTPTPDTDGVTYSDNVTGTALASHATVCTDTAGRTMASLGVGIGKTVSNVTDGSSGVITAVLGTTFTVTLAGGTDNDWDAGDAWTILAGEFGVVTSITGMTTTGNITGRNSAASATVCTDSAARTMSALGAGLGMMALNITDGSGGQITDVTGSTFTATLTGGAANTWAIGDSWTILAGEYGVVTSIAGDEAYIFSSNVGELIDINALTGNVYLEYYRKPLTLSVDGQYPETPEEIHQFLPEYAIWWLKRRSSPGSDDLNEAMVAKQVFDEKIPPAKYSPVDQAVEVSQIRFNW